MILFWPGWGWAGSMDVLPSVVGDPGQPIERAWLTDLDGDGMVELTLGIPSSDLGGHEAGAVITVSDPTSLAPLTPLATVQELTLLGEAPQDHAGSAIAILDLDGDGYEDLAVGAPDASTEDRVVSGKIYLVYGGPKAGVTASLGDPDAYHGIDRITGDDAFARVGASLFSAPDLNDDGLADLLIGAPIPTPSGEPGTGWLGLLHPEPRGTAERSIGVTFGITDRSAVGLDEAWLVADTQTLAGRAATVLADVNADGRSEVLLGAPGVTVDLVQVDTGHEAQHDDPAGAAWLFLGSEAKQLIHDQTEAVAMITGGHHGDAVPWILQQLGDGRLLVASPETQGGQGGVFLFDSVYGEGEVSIHDADSGVEGDPNQRLGSAVVETEGAFPGLLAIGASSDAGAVLFVEDPAAILPLHQVEVGRLDGCWPAGSAGSTLDQRDGVLTITAPGAQDTDWSGLAAVYTPESQALDAVCTWQPSGVTDADGDGYGADDCDDERPWRHPGALEVCGNGLDDDCDGEVDETCGPADQRCGCATPAGALIWWLPMLVILRRRRSLGLLLLPSVAGAQTYDAVEGATYRLWGSSLYEELQGPVVTGDFSGTGNVDIAVANPHGAQYSFGAGEVFLLPGTQLDRDVWLGNTTAIFGATEHDQLGVSLLAVDEGLPATSLYIGVDHMGLTEMERGELVVFREVIQKNETRILSADSANFVLGGEDEGGGFAQTLASGDLDGDGRTDLVVGAPAWSWGLDVPSRPDGCSDWTEAEDISGVITVLHGGLRGRPVDDKDGFDTVMARELCNPNVVYSPLSVATGAIQAFEDAAWLGWRLAVADLNDDGLDDVITGTLNEDFSGSVHFFPGPLTDLDLSLDDATGTLSSSEAGAYAGWGIDPHDGALYLSSPMAAGGDGKVWKVDGAPDGFEDLDSTAEIVVQGDPGQGLGQSISVGDALAVGAAGTDEVILLSPALDPLLVLGGAPGLGHWVGWIGDVAQTPGEKDDIGFADLALVAPRATLDFEQQGVALILNGRRLLSEGLPLLAEETEPTQEAPGSKGCTTAGIPLWGWWLGLFSLLRRRGAMLWLTGFGGAGCGVTTPPTVPGDSDNGPDDVTPPTVEILRPSGEEVDAWQRVILSVAVEDDQTLERLTVSVDGTHHGEWFISGRRLTLDSLILSLEPGQHTISAVAEDVSGNVGQAQRSYQAIASWDCAVTATGSKGTVALSVNVSPRGGGVDHMDFYWVKGGNKRHLIGGLSQPIVDGLGFVVWQLDWDTINDGYPDGDGTVEVDIYDEKGVLMCTPGVALVIEQE